MSLTNTELDQFFREARQEKPVASYEETTRAFLAGTIAISGGILATKSLLGLFKLKTTMTVSGLIVATTTAIVVSTAGSGDQEPIEPQATAVQESQNEPEEERRPEAIINSMEVEGNTVTQVEDSAIDVREPVRVIRVEIPVEAEEPVWVIKEEECECDTPFARLQRFKAVPGPGDFFFMHDGGVVSGSLPEEDHSDCEEDHDHSDCDGDSKNSFRNEAYYADSDEGYPDLDKGDLKKPHKTIRKELEADELIEESDCCLNMKANYKSIKVNGYDIPKKLFDKYAKMINELIGVDVFDKDASWSWTSCHCKDGDEESEDCECEG